MGNPHVLAIPYPAQGHVIPLMELCQVLVRHGSKVSFVNTEHIHKRVLDALRDKDVLGDQIQISLISIPDGLEPWEDRNELGRLTEAICQVMPGKLEELINRINMSEDEKITCVIADENLGWALEVAEKMKIRRVAFWPSASALLASLFIVPKLIDDGIIDNDGNPLKNHKIQLAPKMPAIHSANFPWTCFDLATRKVLFDLLPRNNKAAKMADKIICNSAYDLEPGAFDFAPKILPIGPLLASTRLGDSAGCFWPEDVTCLKWLDQQQPNSVIYVAFGSFTVFDNTQFQELALGLELTNRPFLWVVRPDITTQTNDAYPEGFQERVADRGKMVCWAPQQKALSHPSIACFLSHCGWNSTMEGVGNGIPFLCWPYFADQFLNENYICDDWKLGLKFDRSETGIISREEIKNKVEQVVDDRIFKLRALELKELAMASVADGGCSSKILNSFIEWMNA